MQSSYISSTGDDTVVEETTSVSALEGNVTCVTPIRAPRVSDDPVSVGIVTDKKDGVVSLIGLAGAFGEDTAGVVAPSGSINADGDRLNVQGSNEISGVVSNGSMAGRNESCGKIALASTVNTGVRIRSFSDNTSNLSVVKGFIRPGTIASITSVSVSTTAVNKLLLRERDNIDIVEDDVGTFKKANSGESPA